MGHRKVEKHVLLINTQYCIKIGHIGKKGDTSEYIKEWFKGSYDNTLISYHNKDIFLDLGFGFGILVW